MATKNTVNIHGKEYETVASRVSRFKTDNPELCLITELVYHDADKVIMKASVTNQAGDVWATGHAEERRDSSQINRTSALENAETSAIGRALAAFGMAGTEYASADEVATAIGQRSAPAASTAPKPAVGTAKPVEPGNTLTQAAKADQATLVQRKQIQAFLQGLGVERDAMAQYLEMSFGIIPGEPMTKEDAQLIIRELRAMRYEGESTDE